MALQIGGGIITKGLNFYIDYGNPNWQDGNTTLYAVHAKNLISTQHQQSGLGGSTSTYWDDEAGGCADFKDSGVGLASNNNHSRIANLRSSSYGSANDILGTHAITAECWIKTTDSGGPIFSKPHNGAGQYNWGVNPGGPWFRNGYSDTTSGIGWTNIAGGGWSYCGGSVNCNTGEAYSVMYNARDGLEVASGSISTTCVAPSNGWYGGHISIMTVYGTGGYSGGNQMLGKLALFRFYFGTCLTPGEMVSNMNAQRGRFGV